eukprot:Phypoly_transcript_06193.p1 GENE.Phypoly_transcript_06193~~Phypoly_transcript_06193.p1  ORF type:complete len:531 (+),score=95.94 Phypoly_transcript_06193:35-1594(+)
MSGMLEPYVAAWGGDLDGLKEFISDKKHKLKLDKKCKVEKGDRAKYMHLSGKTLIYLACQKGHDDVVEYLLGIDSDPLAHTNIHEAIKTHTMFSGHLRHHRNALHAAILYAQQDCIDILLKRNPEKLVNSEGHLLRYSFMGRLLGSIKNKFYPLHLAVYTLSPEVTKQLCDLGAKPDLKETSHGYTPFLCLFNSRERMDLVGYKDLRHISSEEGRNRESRVNMVISKPNCSVEQRQIVDILLQHGANKHAQDREDRNAVHLAACDMNVEMLEYVLTLGVSPHTIDAHGNTPLHNILACARYTDEVWRRWIDIVKILVTAGVDLDARNSAGKTLLHLCAESRFPASNMVREAIVLGADSSVVDKNGLTPLFLAASVQEHEDTIQEFLRHPKSDYKYTDRHGNSLFHYVARNTNSTGRFIAECVALGLDINARNNKGATALHTVAKHRNTSAAQYLIENGANVNAKDNKGNSPLHYANKKTASYRVMDLLCASGADINTTNNKGQPTMSPRSREHFTSKRN